MQPIKALFFDLDQTLLDGSLYVRSIAKTCEQIARQNPELDATRVLEANSAVFAEFGPAIIDDWTLGRITGRELGIEAWRRTLQECGQTDESLVMLASSTHVRFARETYRLFDDARRLIDVVARAQIPTALITNGASDTQRDKLEAMGLHEWFDVLVISGEIGVAKPDASAFTPALDHLGVSGKNVWHIGDNLTTDVVGAQAAGVTGVWLNRRGETTTNEIRPDLEIQSLVELVGLLPD